METPPTVLNLAAVAAALGLHEAALPGRVAIKGGAAGGHLAAARVRLGAAPALQARRSPRAGHLLNHGERRPHRHHVRVP